MYYCYVDVQQYNMCERIIDEEFEDTKGVIRSRKTKKDRQDYSLKKKNKQRSTKHYTEN